MNTDDTDQEKTKTKTKTINHKGHEGTQRKSQEPMAKG
jgi:hypothetical protein